MKLAPSKNPEQESKQFSTLSLILGIGSLFIWPLAVGGLAFGVRGIILSKRVNNSKYLTYAIIGALLSLVSFIYRYS